MEEQFLTKFEKVLKPAKTFRSKIIKALEKVKWRTSDL
jgi:hypothetical protein